MALVPHIKDENRDKILKQIDTLKNKGGAEAADELLEKHNIKVGENDKKVAAPTDKGATTAKQPK